MQFSKHFSRSQLFFEHDDPMLFITSQWQSNKSQPSIVYLLYRTIQMVFFLVVWGISVDPKAYVFLTFWSYTLDTFQSVLAFIMLFIYVLGCRCDKPHWKGFALNLYPLHWISSGTASIVAFMVTIIFWSFVYPGGPVDALSIMCHGIQSMQLLLDLCISARPVRFLHFVYPILFGVIYTIFSISFYFVDTNNGGKGYVYEILNWAHPGTAVTSTVGCYILLILLKLAVYGIYRLRLHIYRTYSYTGNDAKAGMV